MMSYFATAAFATSMLFSLVTASPEKAVTFEGSIQPNAAQAYHFTVTVQLDIRKGWHTYDEAGEGPEVPMSLELKLPEGVTAKGDWSRPDSMPGTAIDSLIYEGQINFSRNVVIESGAYGKNIDVIVSYQACNDNVCNRPQSKTVSIAIPNETPSSSSLFEHPVRIDAGADGKPLNALEQKRFLSPGIFDVDADGQTELVIGTLMGNVFVYENQNTSGTGDPVWGSQETLKDAEGKAIQTSNW